MRPLPFPMRLALLARAAATRARTDPSLVGRWLVTRRGGLGRVVALALLALRPVAPTAAALLRGDRPSPEQLDRHVRAGGRGARGVVLACLATGDARLAVRLLEGRGPAPSSTSAAAFWQLGRWDEAVRAAPAGSWLHRRLAAEREAQLAPLPARRATPRPASSASGPAGTPRALHVVTNALPWTRSGYTVRTREVLRAQRSAGIDVAVATAFGFPATILRLPPAGPVEVDGVRHHPLLPRRWPGDPWAERAAGAALMDELVRRERPDVLHAHSHHPNAALALEAGRRHGLPVVYEVRGLLHETWAHHQGAGAEGTQRYLVHREREAEAWRAADVVLTLGGTMRERVLEGAPGADVRIVPNAVGPAMLAALADPRREHLRAAVRARLGVDEDDLLVGSVSSLVDYEGFDVLLDALALPGMAGVRGVLVGDGAHAAHLRARARSLPTGRVMVPGRVPAEQVPDHLAALDVFVVPRLDSAVTRAVTPLKPAEAMAAGLPLVVSDLPALREFVDDRVDGRLVAPGDARGLADALLELRDPRLREDLGSAARERVLRTRTWAANGRAYRQVYEEVLG